MGVSDELQRSMRGLDRRGRTLGHARALDIKTCAVGPLAARVRARWSREQESASWFPTSYTIFHAPQQVFERRHFNWSRHQPTAGVLAKWTPRKASGATGDQEPGPMDRASPSQASACSCVRRYRGPYSSCSGCGSSSPRGQRLSVLERVRRRDPAVYPALARATAYNIFPSYLSTPCRNQFPSSSFFSALTRSASCRYTIRSRAEASGTRKVHDGEEQTRAERSPRPAESKCPGNASHAAQLRCRRRNPAVAFESTETFSSAARVGPAPSRFRAVASATLTQDVLVRAGRLAFFCADAARPALSDHDPSAECIHAMEPQCSISSSCAAIAHRAAAHCQP